MDLNMKKRFAAAAAMALGSVVMPHSGNAAVVINEIYQNGGNSGGTYTTDYVELFNNGSASVTVTGDLIQYGSAAGNFASNTFTNFTLPTAVIPAGGFYLIGGAGGTNAGTTLSNVDFTTVLNLAAAGGKVRLLDTTGATIDLVGYGTAVAATATTAGFTGPGFETSPASVTGLTGTNGLSRTNGVDTDNNANDFSVQALTPTGSTSGGTPEPASLGIIAGAGALLIGRRRKA